MSADANEQPNAGERTDDTLAETARQERDYLRERLRAERGRAPTDEELNDWLRQHTEGY
jgi:hypothetical protein